MTDALANKERTDDFLRRLFLARQPLPEDLTFTRSGGIVGELTYYSWSTISEAMDSIFPGAWSFHVRSLDYYELTKGSEVHPTFIAVGSVTIYGELWGYPNLTRENAAQTLCFRGKKAAFFDAAPEDAVSTALKRACALFGLGRHLYDDKRVDFSVADFLTIRNRLGDRVHQIIEKLSSIAVDRDITNDLVQETLMDLKDILINPSLGSDEDAFLAGHKYLDKIEERLDK